MFLIIIFLPFCGFLFVILFGRYLGVGSAYLSTALVFFSFVSSLYCFLYTFFSRITLTTVIGDWIFSDSLNIQWSFSFDNLTIILITMITFISTLVHLYSIAYMENDPHKSRFMAYLSLFTFFMLILITSNNFLQMFIGWEGVGLASYLLINFWFTRIQANKSAIKAMLVNRVGDFFILISILLIATVFNTLDYELVFSLSNIFFNFSIKFLFFKFYLIDCICLCLFLGAMGKSAQMGLHVWLPDAMEGPTPVSALIHAATMVTSGIFLIARCSHIFELSPLTLNFIIIIGSLTAFFGSTTGLFQNDMKKVIAYSTCSQLGYMIFACGLSSYEVGVFHLFNHAFFKALLFLGAGSIIHGITNEQDIRGIGGLRKLLPFSYSIMVIGSLALIGFPFLTGFFSKDIILEVAFARNTFTGYFSFILGVLAAFFSAFYSMRLIGLIFLTEYNGNKSVVINTHEGSWQLYFPLFLLCFLTIILGFFMKDLLIGDATDFWGMSLYILPKNNIIPIIEFIDLFYKSLPLFAALSGLFLGIIVYYFNFYNLFMLKKKKTFQLLYLFFNKKWFFDRLYNQLLTQNFLYYGYYFSYKDLDRGVLELIGPHGLIDNLQKSFEDIKNYQSGEIFYYLAIFFIALLTIIFFVLFIY